MHGLDGCIIFLYCDVIYILLMYGIIKSVLMVQVNGGTNCTTTSVNLFPNTRVPGPVELVLDIRREYAKELELVMS